MKNAYLTDILLTLDHMTSAYDQELSGLHSEQLNWKPNPTSWSVGQCVDHVITSNRLYFDMFESLLDGTKPFNIWEKIPFLPALFGKLIIDSTKPISDKKHKTVPVFEPSKSQIPGNILDIFLETQKELIKFIRRSDTIDHKKTIVTSPASKFITYSLRDVCIILSGHEERHLNQARNVMETEGFPK